MLLFAKRKKRAQDMMIISSWIHEKLIYVSIFFYHIFFFAEQFVGCQRSVISHNLCDTPCRLISGSARLNDWIHVKHVLNWTNVCSLNILWTVWRTMIHFLIELLVRQTWFGQFTELYVVLNWLVMRCKLRPELAADAQQTAWLKM